MNSKSNLDGLVIRRTFEEDLENVRALWSRGDVMAFVGFPTGLQRSIADMERWLARKLANAPLEQHFSIYDRGVFCGEAYYRIEPEHGNAACMDIKLLPSARGRGIASSALSFALGQAFEHGASFAWVDPVPENLAAIALVQASWIRAFNSAILHIPTPVSRCPCVFPFKRVHGDFCRQMEESEDSIISGLVFLRETGPFPKS